MRRRRRDLFPPDRGLQVRMAVALFVGVALFMLAALFVVAALLVHDGFVLILVALAGIALGLLPSRGSQWWNHALLPASPDEVDRVARAVQSLCLIADHPVPDIEIVRDPAPNSWVVKRPRRPARICVTTTLVRQLGDAELRAVLAHELTHVLNGDATLMTVLAGPPTWFLRGLRRAMRASLWSGMLAISYAWFGVPLALLMAWASRLLSRYRELAADRGAAILTGDPSALSSALLHVAGGLRRIPTADLRRAGIGDPFHLLPMHQREPRRLARMWASHPRLEVRLKHLERMEHSLQTARLSQLADEPSAIPPRPAPR